MTKSMVRTALLSSVSLVLPALSAAFLLPAAASAQTVCTGTPDVTETDIECTDGGNVVVTGTTDTTTAVNPAPQGLSLTSGAAQTTTLQPGPDGDTITTTGSTGIFASSGGPLTLTAPDVNVATTSVAIPIDSVLFTAPILTATLGDITNNSLLSSALEISVPGAVTVTTGDLTTLHPASGHVVNVPGGGGPLSLTTGDISGVGSNAAGVFLLRFGPVTLNTGTVSTNGVHSLGIAIEGNPVLVNVTAAGITTLGPQSPGLFVDTNGAITANITGPITTAASNSNGVEIQGQFLPITLTTADVTTTGPTLSAGIHVFGFGPISVDSGNITTSGAISPGLFVQGGNGPITVSTGNLTTHGADSFGLLVQSIGNIVVDGTGSITTTGLGADAVALSGGDISGTLGDIRASGANSLGLQLFGAVSGLTVGNVVSTQDAVVVDAGADPIDLTTGDASTSEDNAPAVSLTSTGAITYHGGVLTTTGDASDALLVTGGAGAIDASIGGASTDGLDSDGVEIAGDGAITLASTGDITTSGDNSTGILINSSGGPVVVNALGADVTTSGVGSDAVDLTGDSITAFLGNLTVTASSVSADALNASTSGGAIDINTGNLSAASGGAAARIVGGAEPIDLITGDVVGNFGGIGITGTGIIFLETGTIRTNDNGDGVAIQGGAGAIIVRTLDITAGGLGAGSNGLDITGTGPITLRLGNVSTVGDSSAAILVSGGVDTIDATFGNVSTGFGGDFGIDADGVVITGTGAIILDGGNIATAQQDADGARLTGDSISGTLGDITTSGPNTQGIVVTGGVTGLTVGNVVSAQDAVVVNAGSDPIDLTVGDVSTSEATAPAVTLNSTGAITFDGGTLSTTGASSFGLDVNGGSGAIDVATDGIATSGSNATGASIASSGDVTTDLGVITTLRDDALGIIITNSGTGTVTVGFDSIATQGLGSAGVSFNGANADVVFAGGDVTAAFGQGIIVNAADDISGILGDITTTGPGAQALILNGGVSGLTVGNVVSAQEGVVVNAGADPIDLTVGDVSTSETGAAAVTLLTVGSIDFTGGTLSTIGASSSGLSITGGAGPIAATVAGASTVGDNSSGINIFGAGGVTVTTTGLVSTAGFGAGGVVIVGNAGPIIATVDDVTTTGVLSTAVLLSGSGPITFEQTGSISTSGASARGLQVLGGSGPISATLGNVSTSGASTPAVEISGTGTITLDQLAGTTLSTTGANTDAVLLSGAAVGGTIGDITATGANSRGLVITGEVDGLVVGDVLTTQDAIVVNAGADPIDLTTGDVSTSEADASAVTLNSTGAITFDGGLLTTTGANSFGLFVTGGTGAIDVTVAGANTTSSGVTVLSQTGPVTVTNTGAIVVTGGVAGTHGIAIQTNGGPITVNSGDVSGPSSGVSAFDFGATGSVTVNATGDITGGSAGVVARGPNVTLNVLAGNTVAGTDFGAALTGINAVTVNLDGTLESSGGPALLATALNTAPFDVNIGTTGTLNGRVTLGVGNDVIDNGGLFNAAGTSDFGAGTDVFNNLAAGTVQATGGAASFINLETFNNTGLVTLVDGAANDTLTISGNFVGNGGDLALDVVGTPTGNTADELIVGGNISGSTTVQPNLVNPVIDPDGVLIVDGGGTLSAGAFTLADASEGFIDLSLLTTGNDVFLVTTPNVAVFDVGLLGSMAQDLWYQSADVYLSCAQSRRNQFGTERKSPLALCANLYWSRDRFGDRSRDVTIFATDLTVNDRLETHRRGAQVDLGFGTGNFVVGVTGGYERAESNLDTGTNLVAEGRNYGAFAQYGAAAGFYAGVMVKHDNYDTRLTNPVLAEVARPDASANGIDAEAGWRTNSFGPMLDLNLGVSHVKTKFDDFDAGNIDFDLDDSTSTRGRVGARLGWSGEWAPYVQATLFREFSGDSDVVLVSGTVVESFEREGRGTWARLEGGLGAGPAGGPLLSVWGDFGNVKGVGVRAGFRF